MFVINNLYPSCTKCNRTIKKLIPKTKGYDKFKTLYDNSNKILLEITKLIDIHYKKLEKMMNSIKQNEIKEKAEAKEEKFIEINENNNNINDQSAEIIDKKEESKEPIEFEEKKIVELDKINEKIDLINNKLEENNELPHENIKINEEKPEIIENNNKKNIEVLEEKNKLMRQSSLSRSNIEKENIQKKEPPFRIIGLKNVGNSCIFFYLNLKIKEIIPEKVFLTQFCSV